MRRKLALAVLWLSACNDAAPPPPRCARDPSLPGSFTLAGAGVTVEVTSAPYGYTVRDGDGTAVLTTLGPGAGDGYGGVAWTTGLVSTDRFVAPGYFSFYPTLDPWRDRFEVVAATQEATRLTVTLADPGDDQAACVTVVHELRPSTLRVSATVDGGSARAWAAAFTTAAGEGFLGFGERFNRTDQRGRDVWSWAEEGGLGTGEGDLASPENPWPNGEMMTYYPVPFFVSTAGYGFWMDTAYRSEFNLASARADAWRVWHVGPRLDYEVYLPIPDDPRPWPYHLVDGFTAATGRPLLPPAWTLGPRRRIGPGSQALGVPEIQAMRDQDLAITAVDDALHFYPAASHLGREEATAAWIASARELGYRVNGYYNSFLAKEADTPISEIAAQAEAAGYFLRDASGAYPYVWILTGGNVFELYIVDFTNPAATAWYASTFEWALDLGYSGWMYDFGEYVPGDALGFDGQSGETLHNLYPVLYAKAIHDALEAGPQAGDWLAFMRSGYTGSSAYVPMVWSGDPAASFEDSDGLPSMVRAGVNLGISGAPMWGGDIGGFHCNADGVAVADEELLTRWIQQGALSPGMQDQNACVGGDSSLKASIWNAPAALEAWRTYGRLHTRLFPYLYSLAHEASATGAPIMRHVFFEHPDRPDLAGVDDAYYFGPALYVAPVVERGAVEKTVDLPAGPYLGWSDGTLYAGGAQVTLDAPLGELPLLLRAGHLVPLLDATIDTLAEESRDDVVGPGDVADVYDVVGLLAPAAAQATFTLWDGGTLEARLEGAFAPPAGLPEAADEAELLTCAGCWRLDALAGGLARVRISAPAGTVAAGGLTLTSAAGRRIRWELYLAP